MLTLISCHLSLWRGLTPARMTWVISSILSSNLSSMVIRVLDARQVYPTGETDSLCQVFYRLGPGFSLRNCSVTTGVNFTLALNPSVKSSWINAKIVTKFLFNNRAQFPGRFRNDKMHNLRMYPIGYITWRWMNTHRFNKYETVITHWFVKTLQNSVKMAPCVSFYRSDCSRNEKCGTYAECHVNMYCTSPESAHSNGSNITLLRNSRQRSRQTKNRHFVVFQNRRTERKLMTMFGNSGCDFSGLFHRSKWLAKHNGLVTGCCTVNWTLWCSKHAFWTPVWTMWTPRRLNHLLNAGTRPSVQVLTGRVQVVFCWVGSFYTFLCWGILSVEINLLKKNTLILRRKKYFFNFRKSVVF
jgi:hypothetical protein